MVLREESCGHRDDSHYGHIEVPGVVSRVASWTKVYRPHSTYWPEGVDLSEKFSCKVCEGREHEMAAN